MDAAEAVIERIRHWRDAREEALQVIRTAGYQG
jgi:hypothetical protein